MALNPFHKVPVLIDEDDEEHRTVIYDSTVIDEYLEDEYPEPALLPPPGDSAARARVRQLEDYADMAFVLAAGNLLTEHVKAEGERDAGEAPPCEGGGRSGVCAPRARGWPVARVPCRLVQHRRCSVRAALLLLVAHGVALPEGARALRGYVDRLRQRESIRRLEGL